MVDLTNPAVKVTWPSVQPHLAATMSDNKRNNPLRHTVGPFDFPIKHLRPKLQIGNHCLGESNSYTTDSIKRAIAFNCKKLMDIMLNILSRPYSTDKNKSR